MNKPTPVTNKEAQEALTLVEQTAQRMRQALGESAMAEYFLIWGVVWTIGFLSEALLPNRSGQVWMIGDGLGLLATIWVSWRRALRVRSPQYAALGRQIGLFWLGLFFFGAAILWVAAPPTEAQMGLLISLIAMLGYWVMGFWVHSKVLSGTGVAIAILLLLGYYGLPQWFPWWMAIGGGGGLIGVGWYLRRGRRK